MFDMPNLSTIGKIVEALEESATLQKMMANKIVELAQRVATLEEKLAASQREPQ